MMAAEITGSVGVRQAEIARQDMKLRDGKSSNINPGEICAGKPFGKREERTYQQQRSSQ